ncbi:MAG: hypothetical protein J1F60_02635 [Oscillospiraceae bacterium]|nr:hypothetical protein [Oscillospiraceae bacterium]
MKLSNKELTILSVFLAIVIMVAGTFVFILPEYEKIEPNKNTLQSAKDEKNRLYASLERENTIDQEIQDAIDQANKFALYFYEDLTTYEADVIVREILEATNMSAKSLTLSDYAASELTVTDYVETMVSYPLKDFSGYDPGILNGANFPIEYDENGKLIVPEAYVEKYGDQALTEYLTAKLSTQAQTVGAITVTFTIEGTRGDFLNFLNYVADLDRATIINNTKVSYTSSANNDNNNNNNGAPAEGEGEEAAPAAPAGNGGDDVQLNDNSKVSALVSMTLYCVTPMQEQVFAEAEPAE